MKNLEGIISKGMNARRRRSKQVIYEEDEEYRGVDRALGHTRID